MIRQWTCRAIGTLACLAPTPVPATAPLPAEFSLRWSPTDGGPASAAAVLRALSLPAGAPRRFRVEYLDLPAPADAPPGFSVILRERVRGSRHELTYKLRGDHAVDGARCPLPSGHDTKTEIDFWFGAARDPQRAWSFSCSLQSTTPIPSVLGARSKDCIATMERFEGRTPGGKVQVEAWVTRSGATMFEVSRSGRDTPDDVAAFRRDIVDAMLALGAKPLAGGMTQAACGN
jgi:hypothetical protein